MFFIILYDWRRCGDFLPDALIAKREYFQGKKFLYVT